MKRMSIILVIVCVFLCGCGVGNIPKETSEPIVDATTETTSATEVATSAETTSAPKVNGNKWEVIHLTDEFGDETNKLALATTCVGTFSNTATSESDLLVRIVFSPTFNNDWKYASIGFYLYEYKKNPATFRENEKAVFKAKIGDEIYEEELTGVPSQGAVYLINWVQGKQSTMLPLIGDTCIENEKDIRCIFEIGSSKYRFTITGENYVVANDEMMHAAGYENWDTAKMHKEEKEREEERKRKETETQ